MFLFQETTGAWREGPSCQGTDPPKRRARNPALFPSNSKSKWPSRANLAEAVPVMLVGFNRGVNRGYDDIRGYTGIISIHHSLL